MPLPLGHAAIGLAAYETVQNSDLRRSRWRTFAFVSLLANLPDVDVILGLLLQGNGNLFHRGPTHSLFFALLAGYIASHLWRLGERIPRLGFPLCFGLIFSHVLADMMFTAASVSLLWPFQLYFSPGFSGWGRVVHAVLFQSIQDVGIIAACGLYIGLLRVARGVCKGQRVPVLISRRRP
ncbi:MAG: metal-dependent hydrolase [Desulfobacteraceae bacterium]|nr:metal-dependent hydrolase [Desulfobacteraceae bacterium]MBC2753602.1 metal-dependent hydrolase [Desulfobacteraceae bacterium]